MAVPKRNADDDEEPTDDHNEMPAAEPGASRRRRLRKAVHKAAAWRRRRPPRGSSPHRAAPSSRSGGLPQLAATCLGLRGARRHLQPQGHEDLVEVLAPLEQLPQLAQHLKAEVVQVQGGYARVRIQARS